MALQRVRDTLARPLAECGVELFRVEPHLAKRAENLGDFPVHLLDQPVISPALLSPLVFGEVTGVYIDDNYIRDGRFVMSDVRTIARCGYRDYAVVDALFEMSRPKNTAEGV